MNKIVLVTGGFDPLHSGHISYFNSARKLGDELYVGLNSDQWLTRKKGQAFLPFKERKAIIENLSMVDGIVSFDDSDDTACGAIFKMMSTVGNGQKIIFANGGDRDKDNIPEMQTYKDKIQFAFGVGGNNKVNSSSRILENWKQPKVQRAWGWYRVLQDRAGYKIKELIIEPGKSLSMQRHEHRTEHWYCLKGEVVVDTINVSSDIEEKCRLKEHQTTTIQKKEWHKGSNQSSQFCHILEVQYGNQCIEEDIERRGS